MNVVSYRSVGKADDDVVDVVLVDELRKKIEGLASRDGLKRFGDGGGSDGKAYVFEAVVDGKVVHYGIIYEER